jgi:hypothetical protein
MHVASTHDQLRKDQVVLEPESIGRLSLDACLPQPTRAGGIAASCRAHLGRRFASIKQATAMTEPFGKFIRDFVMDQGLDLVGFRKGQRKDDVVRKHLRSFSKPASMPNRTRTPLLENSIWPKDVLTFKDAPPGVDVHPCPPAHGRGGIRETY